ncbi:MAG: TetR/AcrR family transcriptional regulator [Hyphomonas sp.]|nr:TetR/AcrR family transcriptional regulator [Hyphomonas sp.]
MRERTSAGRPREFDDTEVLRKITGLFWKSGFEGVSLSQIMSATGLQKASLYAAFGDKRAMYLKALQQYHSDTVTGAARALKDETVPPIERLRAFLSAPLTAAEHDRSGCFLCNASADQADLNPETRTLVRTSFETLAKAIEVPLRALTPDLNATALENRAQLLLGLYSGYRIMVRSGVDVGRLFPGIDAALQIAQAND